MANPEHLAKLQEGVETWNAWRAANPEVRPDLSETDLTSADLYWADLHLENLDGAKLCSAELEFRHFPTMSRLRW